MKIRRSVLCRAAQLALLLVLAGMGSAANLWATVYSDPCTGTPPLPVGSAFGCGIIITVTAVDNSGNATAATITTPGNGNPYDGTEDTLVGIINNSSAPLNSITLVSSNTTFGGLFGFDGDGPCQYAGNADCFPKSTTGYEGPNNTFTNISSDKTSGTVSFTTPIGPSGTTWFALEGTPQSLSVVTQQGNPITSTSGLTQSFVFDSTTGSHLELDFDYSVAQNNGDLTIQNGTTPFVSGEGISVADWASITNGTSMAGAPCLLAAGQTDALGNPMCFVNTLTCTTSADPIPSGANCPQSTARNIKFNQEIALVQNQAGIVSGILTIPTGYAPGMAEAPDALTPGGQCSYPSVSPLAGQICPRSILTQIEDNNPKPGGTGAGTNSTYVFFCCEPEWQTTPTIPLWSKSTTVSASLTSVPPATPNPNSNNFHAAQGAFVVAGAEPHGVVLDTTYPLPGEQSLNNPIPCPAPPATWSEQNPQTFSVSGLITTFDNGTTTPAPLIEGAYDAHYFSVDCDDFEELVYPGSLNVMPGAPGSNVVSFKTVPFNIDLTAPSVGPITLNPPGGFYAQNSSVTASFTCTDPISNGVASGIATCGPNSGYGGLNPVMVSGAKVPTNVLGSQTFTATAADVAGNSSPTASVTYQVVGPDYLAIGMIGNLLVKTGTNLTYDIFVVNSGPNTADLVTVTDTLPAGTSFVSSGYAIESCTFSKGQPPHCSITPPTNSCGSVSGSCSIGTLPAWTNKNAIGAVVQITVKVNANPNTIITDTAAVSGANFNSDVKYTTAKWATLVTKK